MELTFLGTGGAFTDFRVNYHNNLVVDCGFLDGEQVERYILIDCGATAVQSLKELGIKSWEVEGVVVTHLHGDHVGGIEQLLWERFYTGPHGPGFKKTALYATPDVLEGVQQFLTPCVDEFTSEDGIARVEGYAALVEEVPSMEFDEAEFTWHLGHVQVRFHRTPHVESDYASKPAYGIELISAATGGSAYYTSDTMFRSEIGELFPDAQIIFHDCTFSPKYKGTVHTHYEDLLTLDDETRSRIILMHHTQVPEPSTSSDDPR